MNATETISISTKEAAKLIRQRLKKEYPGVKFQVTSNSHWIINVYCEDQSICLKSVSKVLDDYMGVRYDYDRALESYTTKRTVLADGKLTTYNVDAIFTHNYCN